LDIATDAFIDHNIAPAISETGKWVFLDTAGKVHFKVEVKDESRKVQSKSFGQIGLFSEGLAAIDLSNPNFNFLDNHRGREDYQYSDLFSYQGFAKAEMASEQGKPGQWGYINGEGRIVIEPNYHTVTRFRAGKAIVSLRPNAYQVINTKGEPLFEGTYANIEQDPHSDSLYLLHVENPVIGFLDTLTWQLSEKGMPQAKAVGNGILLYRHKNKKWGYQRFSGQLLSDSIYVDAHSFHEGLAAVCLQGKWGYLDTSGHMKMAARYQAASDFSEGKALVTWKDKTMFIDRHGTPVKKGAYGNFQGFNQGVAILAKSGMFGVINLQGDWIVAPKFTRIEEFNKEGIAYAVKEGMPYLVYREGRVESAALLKDRTPEQKRKVELLEREASIFSAQLAQNFPELIVLTDPKLYQNGNFTDNRYIPCRAKSSMGLAHANGTVLLPANFSSIRSIGHDTYKVSKGTLIGYFHLHKGWLYKPWEVDSIK
jgi:hypothetical protein